MTVPTREGMRILPNLPAADYRTYQLLAPRPTHFRPASCAEVECEAHQNGWQSIVDTSTELGRRQADYIRREAGRRYSEQADEHGRAVFTFPAGQRCFADHQVSLDRAPLYVVRDGDWRGNPRGTEPRIHTRPADWVDDFATHQDRLARLIERG
jgi:hypothetical protein